MTGRLPLRDLRHVLLECLDDEWRTPSGLCAALGVGHGEDWVRIALVLERVVNDGYAELKTPGSHVRRFRLRQGAA